MRFVVPQFTEYETRLVGFLSFRQFIFIGAAGVICVIVYFLVGKSNLYLFLLLAIIILGIGSSLAFLKIGGRGLPTVLINFSRFILGSKFYIWKRKGSLVTFSGEMEFKKESSEAKPQLKVDGSSQLKRVRNKLETETK